SVASRRARVATGPLALAGIPSGLEAERAVGPERLVLRDRRRRTPAAVRPAGRAERDRGARGRARDGDCAHRAVARAGRTAPRGAARCARVHAAARPAGRARACDARPADRPRRPRARVVLLLDCCPPARLILYTLMHFT